MATAEPMSFLAFARAIARADAKGVSDMLSSRPELATMQTDEGASRANAPGYFLQEIAHYIYAGDTALHVAAAAFQAGIARRLLGRGANVRARNRRGAEPLHYAADTNHWNPAAQARTIACLIAAGADPNAVDRDGVAPIHRAVRTRSAAAVRALLDGGANPEQRNKSGSMPLDLALQTTGRGGSGSARAREQQERILELLRAQ